MNFVWIRIKIAIVVCSFAMSFASVSTADVPLPKNETYSDYADFFENADVEDVQNLLDSGVDVNLLIVAPFDEEVARILKVLGEPYIREENHLLYIAVNEGSSEVVSFLLKQGANPNVTENYYGKTPLHQAARLGKHEMVKLLIDAGANLEARNKEDATPLCAAASRNLKTVKTLVDAGADVNAVHDILGDGKKWKLLDCALHLYAPLDVIDFLLDIDAPMTKGVGHGTPYFLASQSEELKNTETLKRLYQRAQ